MGAFAAALSEERWTSPPAFLIEDARSDLAWLKRGGA